MIKLVLHEYEEKSENVLYIINFGFDLAHKMNN